MASLAHRSCKADKEIISRSLEGTWNENLLFLLGQSLKSYDFILMQIKECDIAIQDFLKEYQSVIDIFDDSMLSRCKRKKSSRSKNAPKFDVEQYAYSLWGVNVFNIPELKDSAVMQLIGKLGHDFTEKFETVDNFCSWCNLVPNNKISGGKILSSRLSKRKNPVGQIFRIAASPLARDKGEMGNYYRRMKAKSVGLQANVATAHKIARIFFTIIKKKVEYDPQKVGVDEKKLIKIKMDRLEKALDKLNRKYSEAS
ncbi:transposase [Phocaeicola paurosaccharolyticus]|uniref:transposase n=1 Tax=Phocaeicola paurosaccharolyticus TaxID=732242 RepID=UPI00046AC8BF|nr:transposase [Phocaeicola paurosaccharolyticus]